MRAQARSVVACAVAVGLLAWAARAAGAEPPPKVVSGPKVSRSGTGLTVSFKISRPCDVTVRIVDGKGEVVRHLASGMVGLKRAAKPLKAGSLSQSIAWDGKDDAGGKAPSGCKASVAVGMKAKFDKFILWEKDACAGRFHSLTVPDGDTYVNQSSGVHLDTVRVFDAQGKHVRQAWPPNLNRPADAVKGLLSGEFGARDWDGDGVPIKICHNSWYLVGSNAAYGMALTTDQCLIGIRSKAVQKGIWALDRNDFPIVMNWRPKLDRNRKYLWRMAAGTEGDIYIADASRNIVLHYRASNMSPINSFTHNGKEKLEKPRFYLGEMGKEGTDEGHFTGPVGVAVGKDGNLLVLEGKFGGYGNRRIEGNVHVKVYGKDGKFIRSEDKSKFPSPKPVPDAVKASGKNPRVLCFPEFLEVDDKGKLIIMNQSDELATAESDIEGKTPKGIKLPWGYSTHHGYSAFDSGGNWYVTVCKRKQPHQIWKFAPDGKRAKFGAKDAITLGEGDDVFALTKGLCIGPGGDIYVVSQTDKWKMKPPAMTGGVKFGDLSARGEKASQTRVDIYGADGALKKKGIVKSVGINDVAVDRKGNIYIIEGTMWHGAQMGQCATGHRVYGNRHWPFDYLTPEQAKLDPKKDANRRYSLLSRLVKFPPEGGILDDPDGGRKQIWNYAGVSGVSPWNCDSECPASQICLDADERVWVPDSFLYCVKAIDKAGNEMLRIGKYGNEDCAGGGGDKRHPQLKNVVVDPEIPLSYPKGIAVWKDHLFISDLYAHRVMRCRLEYADTKEAAIR